MKRTVALVLVAGLALTLAACKTTTSSSSSSPSSGSSGPTVNSIAGATGTSYAVKNDGSVWAWGENTYGQLGNACASSCANSGTPVQVVSRSGTGHLGNVATIAAGGAHALALKTNGTVVAWGSDNAGQLGNGTTAGGSARPVQVSGLSNVTAIAAGSGWSLALESDGSVWAWGYNGDGELGNNCGSSCASSSTPVQVVGTGTSLDVTAIAAGAGHALALTTNGTVYAWGADQYGQLGNSTTSTSATSSPVRVGSLTNITAIAAGGNFSLARTAGGNVWSWGSNAAGQLGIGTTTAVESAPVRVVNASASGVLGNVTALAAGSSFALALKNDGTVRAWGSNADGQLGNGCTIPCGAKATPVEVVGRGGTGSLTSVAKLGAGYAHALALRSNGALLAWGQNVGGQLGDGTTNPSSSPVKVHF